MRPGIPIGVCLFIALSHCGVSVLWFTSVCAVFVGNKVDLPDRRIKAAEVKQRLLKRAGSGPRHYVEMSALTNENFEKPFLWIVQQLLQEKK